ncbi:amidohydrolase [Actinoplanes sp. NBRC 103695]|uniref:amidohydrolase n=1 Tax=Actinoplanes sp. NBRC 103695 TaxID=3032202 RepID=UPI0024A15D36|nr:amidohydrolase [Actinoplanes sp. NBRC 103695]GLY95306.1 amidohydrolase [Actinoplanes sp. NBRC 103695]
MPAADLILLADIVHTLGRDGRAPTAVAIAGGLIAATGDRSDAREWRGPHTEVLDLGSAAIMPGLVDGHFHPVMGIGMTRGADLTGVRTLDDLRAALARTVPRDGWVEGWGLDTNAFGDVPVTNAPIVEVLGPDVLAVIQVFDAHSAIASPRVLALAGIVGPREFASGASIVCDADGRPTGHLLEMEATALLDEVMPADEPSDRRTRLRDLLRAMAATGLTGANAMDFEDDSAELFAALEDEGDLPIRWRCAPFVNPGVDADGLAAVVDLQRTGGRRWRVDGAKFMIDGVIDVGTAWLDEPDAHGESTACLWPDPDEYRAAVRHLVAAGVPIVTHAIGDAGIRYVLDTFEGITRVSAVPHRMEHLETMPSDLLARFAALDVTASMQPNHCSHFTRADGDDNWSRRLGATRAGRAFRVRDLHDRGARIALGSDWPIASYDPRGIIASARLRRPAGSYDVEPIVPSQTLTARMALEGYTTAAAASAGEGDRAGRIVPGMPADLSAFALDPLAADPDEFAESPVPLTVVGGTVTHRS